MVLDGSSVRCTAWTVVSARQGPDVELALANFHCGWQVRSADFTRTGRQAMTSVSQSVSQSVGRSVGPATRRETGTAGKRERTSSAFPVPPWDWTGRGGTGLDRRGIVVVDASNSKEGVGLRKSRGGGGAIAGTGTGPKGFQVKVPAVLMLTHLILSPSPQLSSQRLFSDAVMLFSHVVLTSTLCSRFAVFALSCSPNCILSQAPSFRCLDSIDLTQLRMFPSPAIHHTNTR